MTSEKIWSTITLSNSTMSYGVKVTVLTKSKVWGKKLGENGLKIMCNYTFSATAFLFESTSTHRR